MSSWKDAQRAYTVKIYDMPGELGGYEWTYGRDAWGAAELMAMHFHGRVLFALNVLSWYIRDAEPEADGRFGWQRDKTGKTSLWGLYSGEFQKVLDAHIDEKVQTSATPQERAAWERWRLTSRNMPAMEATLANLKRLPGMFGMVAQDECRLGGWRDRRW